MRSNASGPSPRNAAITAAGFLLCWSHVAHSQDPAPATDAVTPSVVTAIAGDSIDQTVLVGPSGQLYRPGAAGTWQRARGGGVAVDVKSALGPAPDMLVVAGSRAPLYRLTGETWNVLRLARRGSVNAARDGGVPVLTVGRYVHLFRDGAWASVAQTRARVRAVWASSATRLYVGLANGALDKWSKGTWTRISTPSGSFLGDGRFVGRSGAKLFLLSDTGVILEVGARRARALPLAADLQGFTAHAGAVDGTGGLWLAGIQADPASASAAPAESDSAEAAPTPSARAVLAHCPGRGKGRALTLVEALPAIDLGDLLTVLLRDDDGAMLLATRASGVFVRAPAGGWTPARLLTALPEKARRSHSARPARTR